jgi:hypothetical protein
VNANAEPSGAYAAVVSRTFRSRAISTTEADGDAEGDSLGAELGASLGVAVGGVDVVGGADGVADGLIGVGVGEREGGGDTVVGDDPAGVGEATGSWVATAIANTLPPDPLPFETTTRGRSPAPAAAPKTVSGLATGPIVWVSLGPEASQPFVVGPQTRLNSR